MSDNKKENINENIQLLEELVRKAYELISPIPFDYDLKWLMKQDHRNALFERNPKCFLMLKRMGRDVPFFPVCNRAGAMCPKMIDISLKMIDKLSGNDQIDQNALVVTAQRLQALKSKFSKEIPKTNEMAAKKAQVTKFLNKVKDKYKK